MLSIYALIFSQVIKYNYGKSPTDKAKDEVDISDRVCYIAS